MINSPEQAAAVQTRRVKAKKRGYAKSVRRFLQSVRDRVGETEATQEKQQLPVTWAKRKTPEPEALPATLQDQIRAALEQGVTA